MGPEPGVRTPGIVSAWKRTPAETDAIAERQHSRAGEMGPGMCRDTRTPHDLDIRGGSWLPELTSGSGCLGVSAPHCTTRLPLRDILQPAPFIGSSRVDESVETANQTGGIGRQ